MKLESLKDSKFNSFKGDELTNLFSIKGGFCTNTYSSAQQNLPNDSFRDTMGTGDIKIIQFGTTHDCDKSTDICPIGPSEGQGAITPLPVYDNHNPNAPMQLIYMSENYGHTMPH